jgi:Tannase and feruloyl esterase
MRIGSAGIIAATLALSASACGGSVAGRAADKEALPDCADLQDLQLKNAHVDSTQLVSGGSFQIEHPAFYEPPSIDDLPAFCRLLGTAAPVEGSRIGFEVWLPVSGWNGKLEMYGNGGYGSSIAYQPMAEGLRHGYVTVGTDTGHKGDDPAFARGRPESIVDWGHRAVHVTSVQSRAIVKKLYGRPPDHAYFTGCSTGGHQALMEAQRYPDDFDGIIAGDPGNNRTHLNAGFLWQFLRNHEQNPHATAIIPADKLALINKAVLDTCRSMNGNRSGGLPSDPFLDDPLACNFYPGTLLCRDYDDIGCLDTRQVEALRSLYDGPRNSRTGERIYFGQTPGSEAAGGPPGLPGWSLYWADPRNPRQPARASFWQVWAFDDPDWAWWDFDFDADMGVTDDRLADTINAMDPNLSRFRAAGGKLIQYHGLSDPVVPVADSISYYQRVVADVDRVDKFYRLFLVPGLNHCWGGPGPTIFDMQAALEAWVERGKVPERIVAERHTNGDPAAPVEYTRPLCPYPAYAVYSGAGDKSSAVNFECSTDLPRPAIPVIGPDYLH